MTLIDGHGRRHDELRLSVTDRCNLRCNYCLPEEPVWFPRDALLSFEELARSTALFASAGVRRVRLTGGEPLLRRDLGRLATMLRAIPQIEELSLTTNGLLLERLAAELAAAGVQRVNVSLDTLDPDRFRALTRRDGLQRVLDGLAAARAAGLTPIKVNAVVLRGVNDDEIERLAGWGREQGYELRFIEFMPLANAGEWKREEVVTAEETLARIAAQWPLEAETNGDPTAPARRYRYRDGGGAVGVIPSVTAPFCASCSRLRLTADGHLSSCLYATSTVDFKRRLRDGADDAELLAVIEACVRAKGAGGAVELLAGRRPELVRTMHQLGG